MDTRFLNFEIKQLTDAGEFTGVASPYGTEDLGGDIIEPGAFTGDLQKHGAERPLLWQHDAKCPIGTVTLQDSPGGLLVQRGKLELALDDAKKAFTAIKSKIIKGLSIGFQAEKWEYKKSDNPDGWPTRILKAVRLWEVSIVTFPMAEGATISSVKSLSSIRDFERFLHEAGWSRKEAAALAGHGWKGLQLPEPEDASTNELISWLRSVNSAA
ncbi:MAG: HK97 family phage prohead protease [Bryobacteraceae bacterium]